MDLPPSLQSVAEADLHETPESRAAALEALKQLCSSRGPAHCHWLNALFEDLLASTGCSQEEVLVQHLQSRKFDVEKADDALSSRAAFLQEHPDLAADVSGREFEGLYQRGLVCVLPGTDKHGRRIIMLRPSDLSSFSVDPVLVRWQVFVMTRLALNPFFQVKQQQPAALLPVSYGCNSVSCGPDWSGLVVHSAQQVHGAVLILNFDSLKVADVQLMAGQMTHGRMRLMFHFIRHCAPARIAGIYMVHQPKFISMVWSLVSLFMGSRIKKPVSRNRSHSNRLADYLY
eukprot:gene2967-3252_t